MKRIPILALALCAPLAFAQQQAPQQQYGQGGSPRCDQLSGVKKDECLKAEGAKTEPKALGDSATGSTTQPMDATQSARCAQMTGAQRDQCLNDEGAKTQGAPSPAK